MREERRKTFYNVGEREKEIAVSRRQRSREKNALESEGREIEREPLHDAERRQRSKENNDFKRAGREIRLGVLLYASKRAKRVRKLEQPFTLSTYHLI